MTMLRAVVLLLLPVVVCAEESSPFKDAVSILKGLPKEAQPKGGRNGIIERKSTAEWMKKHLIGKDVEWSANIAKIDLSDRPNGSVVHIKDRFHAIVRLDGSTYSFAPGPMGYCPWKSTKEHGEELQVFISPTETAAANRYGHQFVYSNLTADEAKQLRGLEGKKVSLRATIREVGCEAGTPRKNIIQKDPNWILPGTVTAIVRIDSPAIDGFYPDAMKPKTGK